MASLLSSRRTVAERVSARHRRGPGTVRAGDRHQRWTAARLAGRRGRRRPGHRLGGWILCAGLAVVGWLAAEPGTLGEALAVGTRLWLLANGVSAPLGGLVVTLVPWGATARGGVHDVLVRRLRRPPDPARPARRTVAVAGGAARDLPGAGAGGRGLAGPAVAGAAALGGGHRRARPGRGVGRLPGARPATHRELAGLGPGAAAGRPRRPSWCCWSPGRRCAGHRPDPPSGSRRRAARGPRPRGRRQHRAAGWPSWP